MRAKHLQLRFLLPFKTIACADYFLTETEPKFVGKMFSPKNILNSSGMRIPQDTDDI